MQGAVRHELRRPSASRNAVGSILRLSPFATRAMPATCVDQPRQIHNREPQRSSYLIAFKEISRAPSPPIYEGSEHPVCVPLCICASLGEK